MASSVVKRTGGTELGVQVFGMVHGLLFVALALSLIIKRTDLDWSWAKTFVAIFIGALPFGGFWLERKWLKESEVSAELSAQQS